jgi:hypothetical protein
MDTHDERNDSGTRQQGRTVAPFRFPVAPGRYDRMLAAAHELTLDVPANPATAPVIDAEACADWLTADVARDRRAATRPERRGSCSDRRRR